jgi:hypothetical protein
MSSSGSTPAARRWWPLLLPLGFLLHIGEEWFGDFAVWTQDALRMPVSTTRFIMLNSIVWPSFAVLTVVAIRRPAWWWFVTTFATVVAINTVFHALGSLATWTYSPGLITALCLYLPVGGYALADGSRRLPSAAFGRAVLLGFAIHVAVAVIALW